MDISSNVTLNNGVRMPILGLGVYKTPQEITKNAVFWSFEAGYRHIDTARFYGNEKQVGEAIRESNIDRKDIFVTTKLWNDDHGYDRALRAFDASLKDIGLDYVDLYLIHWPVQKLRSESWKALEKIQNDGQARAIGVSNYTVRHLKELLETSGTVPTVNQVEFSPYLFQKELLDFCNDNKIQLEAYSPLTRGRMFEDPNLKAISEKYSKSPAQILIKWCLQHNVVVIPKSSNQQRIIENSQIFDFNISEEDMEKLDNFNKDFRVTWDPTNYE